MGPTNRDHGRPESVARGAHKLANFALSWGKNDYKTVLSGADLYVNLYVNLRNDNRRRTGLVGQS